MQRITSHLVRKCEATTLSGGGGGGDGIRNLQQHTTNTIQNKKQQI